MRAMWCFDFGQPEAEFWQAHPDDFKALLAQWRSAQDAEYVRAGTIAAEMRNTLRGKKTDKVWTALDIFPHLKPEDEFVSVQEMHAAFAAHARREPAGG